MIFSRNFERLSIQAKKIRSTLDALLVHLKDLPARYKRYDSYDHLKSLINNCIKAFFLLRYVLV